ncbi:hypothetical protein CDD83_3272 [Cordyceps sp. RAO-2017]|nr:hypothetical protein CDD83_3272 [Cordyceps sp. RAO-2017]
MAATTNSARKGTADSTRIQLSPTATSSPSSPPARPVSHRIATPLSLGPASPSLSPLPPAEPASSSAASTRSSSSASFASAASSPMAAVPGRGRGGEPPPRAREDPFAALSPAETPERAVSPQPRPPLDAATGQRPQQGRDAPAKAAGPTVARARQYEAPCPPARDPVARMTNTVSPPDSTADDCPLSHARPLRTASVRADTRLAHPKPIARPCQPGPDLKMRPGSPLGNVAQLEATAERLSMTSSIDDAIRDLHGELKRSDSRRSSVLAASLRQAASFDAAPGLEATNNPDDLVDHLRRHMSTSSSIVSTNTAARLGGYSPAAFVMSPTHSLSGRLRSASRPAVAAAEADSLLSRHGPGKTSDRSVRSARMSLAEISESEPVALTQDALDEADAAPPIDEHVDEGTFLLAQHDEPHLPSPRETYTMPRHDARAATPSPGDADAERPMSSRSDNTFQQCRDAFIDFDGVHWEPDGEHDIFAPSDAEPDTPRLPPPSDGLVRPQSYLDPETGLPMMYYPARVPAMLNVPPKLSNKPKAAQRNQRRSEVLSAMMAADNGPTASPDGAWQSPLSDAHGQPTGPDSAPRASWLPDPIAGHRGSFAALSSSHSPTREPDPRSTTGDRDSAEAAPAADALRRPPRLSAMGPDKRKSRASFFAKLPPQLRASAFFELPSVTADVEIKDGSAMATLDSILDASATAPVSAFTDNTFTSIMDSNVSGKKKKHKVRKSAATLTTLSPEPKPKKRSSLMWLSKRSSSHNGEDKSRPRSMTSVPMLDGGDAAAGDAEDGQSASGSGAAAGENDGEIEMESADDGETEEEDDEDEAYHGPPTTLLAELQFRKKEQQQRKKNFGSGFPNGIHATLLEMDTVAETQRKHRQTKRVNLAWEEPGAHLDQNGSDDEDVPLAILAAMHQGAKNRADLERPMGLMERRALEDNEPLSRRRARLQGLDPTPPAAAVALPRGPSVASFPVLRAAEDRSPRPTMVAADPEPPEQDEIEGETLGDRRRRRLGATDDSESELPKARPVSSSFSTELLSQFGDLDQTQGKPSAGGKGSAATATTAAPVAAAASAATPAPAGGEETLGQRRRRLQAERDAREREMSHGTATAGGPPRGIIRRSSMADILTSYPKKGSDPRLAQEETRRAEEKRAAAEREAKMAAIRKQMPQSLVMPNVERSGGFRGGAYNDGTGGHGASTRPSIGVHSQSFSHGPYGSLNRSSVLLNSYGTPAPAQPLYGAMGGHAFGTAKTVAAGYDGLHAAALYGGNHPAAAAMGMYGGGALMTPAMPLAMSTGSVDRVEQWRRGVHP